MLVCNVCSIVAFAGLDMLAKLVIVSSHGSLSAHNDSAATATARTAISPGTMPVPGLVVLSGYT